MRKYLLAFIPLVVCTILASIYIFIEPQNYPHPSYPYKTVGTLAYLSSTWFVIGVAASVACLVGFVIWDAFDWLEKRNERRHLKKDK